jgi:hypothetical protein
VEVAKQNTIFKPNSIKRNVNKFLIIKSTNSIKYQQMTTTTKHAVNLVKFHQNLLKILEYQNQINLQYIAIKNKEKLRVIIKYLQEKQRLLS